MPKGVEYYMSLPYKIEVVPEACTDGSLCYRASHPELPGCMSHGDTVDEAQANLTEARQLYIATLLKKGLSVPRPVTASSTAGVGQSLPANWKVLKEAALKPSEQAQRIIWEILRPTPEEAAAKPSEQVQFTRAEFKELSEVS